MDNAVTFPIGREIEGWQEEKFQGRGGGKVGGSI